MRSPRVARSTASTGPDGRGATRATVVATDATREQHEEQSAEHCHGSPSAVPTVDSSDAGSGVVTTKDIAALSAGASGRLAVDSSVMEYSPAWGHIIERLALPDVCAVGTSCRQLHALLLDDATWRAIFHEMTQTPYGHAFGQQSWLKLCQNAWRLRHLARMHIPIRAIGGRCGAAALLEYRAAVGKFLCCIEDTADGSACAIFIKRELPQDRPAVPWSEALGRARLVLSCLHPLDGNSRRSNPGRFGYIPSRMGSVEALDDWPLETPPLSQLTLSATWEVIQIQLDPADQRIRGVVAGADAHLRMLSIAVRVGQLSVLESLPVPSLSLVLRNSFNPENELAGQDGYYKQVYLKPTQDLLLDPELQLLASTSSNQRVKFSPIDGDASTATAPTQVRRHYNAPVPNFELQRFCADYDYIEMINVVDRHGNLLGVSHLWPRSQDQNVGIQWHSSGRHLCLYGNNASHTLNEMPPMLVKLPLKQAADASERVVVPSYTLGVPVGPCTKHVEGVAHLAISFSSDSIFVLTQEANFCLPYDANLDRCKICHAHLSSPGAPGRGVQQHNQESDLPRRCDAKLRKYALSDGSLLQTWDLRNVPAVERMLLWRQEYPNEPVYDDVSVEEMQEMVKDGALHLRPEGALYVSPNGRFAAISMRYCFREGYIPPDREHQHEVNQALVFQPAPPSTICLIDISTVSSQVLLERANADNPHQCLKTLISAVFSPDSSMLFWQLGPLTNEFDHRPYDNRSVVIEQVALDAPTNIKAQRMHLFPSLFGIKGLCGESYFLSVTGNFLTAVVNTVPGAGNSSRGYVLFWNLDTHMSNGAVGTPYEPHEE